MAELVLAEAILLLRGVAAKNAAAHRGEWQKTAANAFEIRGKKLGIIGYGNIGMQLGVIAEGLGMQVQFYDVTNKLPLGNARQVPSLNHLLGNSDVVSLHVPGKPATHNMIGADQLAQMPQGSILINASRGTVVDIDALAGAWTVAHWAARALMSSRWSRAPTKMNSSPPCAALTTPFLTPHIGGSTIEAQENIGMEVAEKLARYSDNGTTTPR